VRVLLYGSPLYQDAKEPGFSMVDGYFPSDGHLQTSRENSVFGATGETGRGERTEVDWLYFGDPWISDLHRDKVTRFWTLYLERRGAELNVLTRDFATAMKALLHDGGERSSGEAKGWALDKGETKIEMLRVARKVEATDWLTRDNPKIAQVPPGNLVGPMKIGIRWKENIDLDLYASCRPEGETLFFKHVRSPEGYYYKDHRSSPGKEYEFVEYEMAVDAREVEAFVNFYKGDCEGGPHGEVRIEFDGRIYAGKFFIPASEGNRGRTGGAQQEFWARIPVQELLKISSTANRGG